MGELLLYRKLRLREVKKVFTRVNRVMLKWLSKNVHWGE